MLIDIVLLYYDARCQKHKTRNFRFRAMSENNIADEPIVKRKLYYYILKLCIERGVGKI